MLRARLVRAVVVAAALLVPTSVSGSAHAWFEGAVRVSYGTHGLGDTTLSGWGNDAGYLGRRTVSVRARDQGIVRPRFALIEFAGGAGTGIGYFGASIGGGVARADTTPADDPVISNGRISVLRLALDPQLRLTTGILTFALGVSVGARRLSTTLLDVQTPTRRCYLDCEAVAVGWQPYVGPRAALMWALTDIGDGTPVQLSTFAALDALAIERGKGLPLELGVAAVLGGR